MTPRKRKAVKRRCERASHLFGCPDCKRSGGNVTKKRKRWVLAEGYPHLSITRNAVFITVGNSMLRLKNVPSGTKVRLILEELP